MSDPVMFPHDRREHLRAYLRDTVGTSHQASWRRPVVVVSVAAAVLAGGGVATAVLLEAPATDKSMVRCYWMVSGETGRDFPGTTVGAAGRQGEQVSITEAEATCESLWQQGVMTDLWHGAGSSGTEPPGGHAVPALQACVLPSGVAAVFPSDDANVCDSLGLPRLQTS